ncbi:hypothetical protein AB6887_02030 [Carnobacterium divergens]|uniref:Lactococcin 972 family bacteriocin n=1 Tax=Carnobacterium divergens TaxID=2748 RepID=A0A7Z8G476_CARDV|nr:hypothetical protein [Carnobacterium divergens]TFI72675.1 hypothetical protein CKN58_06750 [Carnobacterium divergens]TFI77114.1 hypothetical protein CKN85_06790 [Carnobacterium divergens]TFI83415.1 hypothetical protein CKN56_06830 [Carnobacterium divergens]TFI95520.1 hypothetical protein CKN64_06770 [Carnobacterium divergens]TFJ11880.1 hypothetical protein CKN60_06835 [Carnobacterium divergens]
MNKKIIFVAALATFIGFNFFSIVVSANGIENTQSSIQSRAHIGSVVRYFHQYQTRATGNWAPNLHRYEYGSISVRNGYAPNGYTYLGTTSRSNWITLEHRFSQNYRVW